MAIAVVVVVVVVVGYALRGDLSVSNVADTLSAARINIVTKATFVRPSSNIPLFTKYQLMELFQC